MKFIWRADDKRGQKGSGCLDASSMEQALRAIRELDWNPVSIRQEECPLAMPLHFRNLTDMEKKAICRRVLELVEDFQGGVKLGVISSWLPDYSTPDILEILGSNPNIGILEYAPKEHFVYRK